MMFTLASSSSAVSSLGGFGSASSATTSSFPSESTVVLASSPSYNKKKSNMELGEKNPIYWDHFSNYYSLHLSCRSVVPIFVIMCFHVRRASKAAKVTLLLSIIMERSPWAHRPQRFPSYPRWSWISNCMQDNCVIKKKVDVMVHLDTVRWSKMFAQNCTNT